MIQSSHTPRNQVSTGVSGLDDVLRGGLPASHLYLLEGASGAGKTTLGLQFLLEGKRQGERVLWCTLAETESQLMATAESHHWDLSGIDVINLADTSGPQDGDYSFFSPSDVELNDVVGRILSVTQTLRPTRVVFDPFSDVKLLARDPLRFRRQLLKLREHFSELGATVLLIQESGIDSTSDTAGEGVVHGIITLYQHAPDYGKQRRRLQVHKMRGVAVREGFHDISIETGGVVVYPRLVANEHDTPVTVGVSSSGCPELDTLMGGGVDLGASLLVTGPSGIGKSTLCMQFLNERAREGGRSAVYLFDETRRAFLARADALGMPTRGLIEQGRVSLRQIDPAEFSPGEFAHLIRRKVEEDGVEMVVIDSLNGYLTAMPDEKHLAMHMHELLSYLSNRGVATLLTLNQQGIVGESATPLDVTYLADAAILMRYFETDAQIRRALSVVKRRMGPHEASIREMFIALPGIRLGQQLSGYRGVLSGLPEARGAGEGVGGPTGNLTGPA
jgi:circadian clock protein KaiC